MSTDVGVGDAETVFIDVAPADVDTAVTLTVHAPDGTSTPVTVTGGDLEEIAGSSPTAYTQRWTADTAVVYDQAGRWVLHWSVTGTGEGAEDLEVSVVASPVAGGPTWWPGISRVAAYVPHRTLVRSATTSIGSADEYAWTFDATTTPPATTVSRLIADGAAWVTALVTPMHTSSEPLAGLLAALWAAIFIERSWPQDDQALPRANDMERQLNTMLAQLIAANDKANGDDDVAGGDYGIDVVWPSTCSTYPTWN